MQGISGTQCGLVRFVRCAGGPNLAGTYKSFPTRTLRISAGVASFLLLHGWINPAKIRFACMVCTIRRRSCICWSFRVGQMAGRARRNFLTGQSTVSYRRHKARITRDLLYRRCQLSFGYTPTHPMSTFGNILLDADLRISSTLRMIQNTALGCQSFVRQCMTLGLVGYLVLISIHRAGYFYFSFDLVA